jgi:hypothetical protein
MHILKKKYFKGIFPYHFGKNTLIITITVGNSDSPFRYVKKE